MTRFTDINVTISFFAKVIYNKIDVSSAKTYTAFNVFY